MSKPQILVKFKSGDHTVFDIEGEEGFKELQYMLSHPSPWILVAPKAYIRKDELERIFYLENGHAPNGPSDVQKD